MYLNASLEFHHLAFKDCFLPSKEIILKFLEICHNCENKGVAIAVHCKAGIGRTGTLIALYLIYKFGLNGPQAIAWCKLCRKGSILGIQNNFIVE